MCADYLPKPPPSRFEVLSTAQEDSAVETLTRTAPQTAAEILIFGIFWGQKTRKMVELSSELVTLTEEWLQIIHCHPPVAFSVLEC